MTLSTLPLSYCSNVHPGLTVEAVLAGLRQFTTPVRQRFGALAAGLWLAQPVMSELIAQPARVTDLRDALREHGLTCYTLNAFPFGNFHDTRVKENVYVPDWSRDSRSIYSLDCARTLAALLPDDVAEGSLSTVPLGFKPFNYPALYPQNFEDQCCQRLIDFAQALHHLEQDTGKKIRLAIEPEPFCVLETTDETIGFFERLRELAAFRKSLWVVDEYIGVCYDVCHQAVEFEDVTESIQRLCDQEIRINKVHITCAIRLEQPATNDAGRAALATFVEPRYLHQTLARKPDGTVLRAVDLTEDLALRPGADFASADEWRIHFHVPVNAESLGPLGTTRGDLKRALAAVRELDYAPHLEVETYTWGVLPDGSKPELVEGLTQELLATRALLTDIAARGTDACSGTGSVGSEGP